MVKIFTAKPTCFDKHARVAVITNLTNGTYR